MNFLQVLKKCFTKIPLWKDLYGRPLAAQKAFLGKLAPPQDDWERSYLQYRCQAFLQRSIWTFLLNCAAAVLLPAYWLYLRHTKLPISQPCEAVLLFSGSRSLVPRSLEEEYNIVQVKDFQNHLQLNKDDLFYLRKLRRRYPFSFYFRFKCMVKIAMYSDIISRYHPKAVLCSEEYSFTSSLLTDYCRQRQTKHINFQHGVKMYFIREAFFHFDRCYVWDQHSADVMSALQAEPKQFIIELPPSLCFAGRTTDLERVDYTYYLQIPSRQELEMILRNLAILQKRGARVAIRPHPLHVELAKSLCKDSAGFLLENTHDISIEQSLLRTNCAIAASSAVLIQAAYNGIPVVIDDITIPGLYDDLKARQYICTEMAHRRLSELLRDSE